ncbi:hypothetical protein SSP24_78820 [Streptomyces spinoverrucosus]|uniref:Uncharacterized protein n=1 Tax=Streptomyces spinoverrucosus TaxID=284043 RepID=A0A4Y3VTQ8_9ACTN|nr:hypothetical protein SSP24_78820 [Streptomyces spinoverrucosus]GHB96349.1 hypothetical protein GCM10010397_81260 [Streptomyces spinoverrucosus]
MRECPTRGKPKIPEMTNKHPRRPRRHPGSTARTPSRLSARGYFQGPLHYDVVLMQAARGLCKSSAGRARGHRAPWFGSATG